MKTKKSNKKLALNKNTIADLNRETMNLILGGTAETLCECHTIGAPDMSCNCEDNRDASFYC
jgi:natural product precursor